MSEMIETLEGLERRIQLTVPAADLESEVQQRLAKLARTYDWPVIYLGERPRASLAASVLEHLL